MMIRKKISGYKILLLVLLQAAFSVSCETAKETSDVQFSYRGIIDKEYRFNVGRVIPVTINQSIETDGDISVDGNYFFYSSDADGGNLDIYLRSMGDITTVRLTAHPSRDITPAVSPDGRSLAFVSYRDDPEGDVFLLTLKPDDLLKRAASGEEISTFDKKASNLTQEKQANTGVIINIKESTPCWSPDGKFIAYSSAKGGESNIWMMKSNGKDKRKITSKGGVYPAFSPDGSRLLYVSYNENKFGDIYSVVISSGKTERITTGNNIKLYPSYANGAESIIYSSIEEDTNSNGELDLQDRSVIRYLNLKSGLNYTLTKSSDTSFKAKWLPVLNTRDYNGIIIYTDITGENINLNIIPELGIIPKKTTAKLQYELCETYSSEYDDVERYSMALESVYNFYGESVDNTSRAYVNRALKEAALFYVKKNNRKNSERSIALLKNRSGKNDLYASFILSLIENRKKDADQIIIKMSDDSKSSYFAPFALEDTGDLALISGSKSQALSIYEDLIKKYPSFERSNDILAKISFCNDDLAKGILSDAAVQVINKGNTNQKISVTSDLVDSLMKGNFNSSEASVILRNISTLKAKHSEDKKIMAILNLASGLVNDSISKTDTARKELAESIQLSHPNDLTFYLANIRLAEMERRYGRSDDAEKYYSAAINRYSRRFKTENFRDKLIWLINYYEQAGERSSGRADFSAASVNYDKYINLLTLMLNKRLYPEIYTEYAPRAHVLYIDAFTGLKGEQGIDELEKKYKDNLSVFRMDSNRAALYGLAYIYTKKAMIIDSQAKSLISTSSRADVFKNLYEADRQIEWALFMDDTFIEPYLLKSWIYQYIDLQRKEYGDDIESSISGLFPKRLWEKNIPLLEKALNANNETKYPENEGNIHINTGNSFFLLLNYPRALHHYRLAQKYKKSYGSDIERALFHFHFGYTLWQNGEVKEARDQISKAYGIYRTMAAGSDRKYKQQILALYRYFALFSRYEEKYTDAIDWYKKILAHAESTGVEIDKARYLQEIAHCCKEKGDYDTAKSYIDQADMLLRDYPDDTRKYYLRIKIFGLGPFPVFNMGPDTAVVGDNRIFYPLDRWNKKLLSISMLEDISVKNSNYTGAIEYLKKKITLLEESATSVAVETKIRSLNNLGYYHFRAGNISESEKYFNEAGNLASEKQNLQGIFTSMMNIANLYALMIENGLETKRNWLQQIETFLVKIEQYRNSYYDLKFNQEKLALEEAAKAKNDEVTPEQIEELKQRIEKETAGIYYELDTSIAIMKFYRAELLFSTSALKKSGKPEYDLYTHNRDIYNLYAGALRMFEGAIAIAESQGKKELKSKLLINAASCYGKTGEYEKAYVALIDAKNISEQYRLGWTGISANYALGNFLAEYGKEVESTDYRGLAEKYMSAAVSKIEEHPLLYTSRAGKIRNIYRGYTEFLISAGRGERAFYLQEKLARVERITSINALNPQFSDEYDRSRYFTYLSEITKLGEIREKRSSLLIAGILPASQEINELNKKEKTQEETLIRLFREIESKSAGIAPYLELTDVKLKSSYNIYSFMESSGGIYSWKFSDGKISSGYLKSDSAEALSSFLSGSSEKGGAFILISDTSLNMIRKHHQSITVNYSLINSVDRAENFSKGNYPAGKVLSSVKGVTAPSIDVEYPGENRSLTGYSVVIDTAEKGELINAQNLFSVKGLSPYCIILGGEESDSASISLLLEAALYTGTNSVIYSVSNNKKDLSALLKDLLAGNGFSVHGGKSVKAGYINSFNDRKPADYKNAASSELSSFNRSLADGDFAKAGTNLSRWSAMSPDEKFVYLKSRWLLELLKGNYSQSLKLLETYAPATPEELVSVKFRKIYTLLHKGDFAEATVERKKLSGGDKYPDMAFIDAIFDAVYGRESAPDRIQKISRPYSTLIPAERYLILAAGYIYLYAPEQSARIINLENMKQLSLNERMMRFIITGEKPEAGLSPRIDRITSLGSYGSIMADESMKLIKAGDNFDSLSVFPPLTVLNKGLRNEIAASYISGLDLERIASAGYTPAVLALLQKCYSSIPENNSIPEKLKILRLMKKTSSDSSVFHVINSSMYRISIEQMIAGDYSNAYTEAASADERFTPEDRDYAGLQLLLVNLLIRNDQYSKAEAKILIPKALKTLKPEEKYLLDLQLSMIELNRLRGLKKATAQDAVEFEKLFSSALGFLKKDPGVLRLHGYREMTESVFDEYINYKMKTSQHSDAHYYNELKKLLISSSVTGINFVKTAGTIDITAIQQALPEKCGYISIAKVKNDIFIWIIDSKMKKALWIENGYKTLSDHLLKYRLSSLQETEIKKASTDLADYFQPLETYFKSRKKILISPDTFTEQVPFEIIGKDKMLSEETRIVYIASPLLLSPSKADIASSVRFIGKPDSGFQSHVEKVAVRESGIKSSDSEAVSGGIAHITGKIVYENPEKGFLLDEKGLTASIGSPDFLYATLSDYPGAGPLDFALHSKFSGAESAVINSSPVSELNRGIFAGEFYRSVSNGRTLTESFASAVEKTRNDSRYRSPAAWGGFRLYINNLGYLKE